MSGDIEVQLHSIYDELMEKPNRIREIFEDFYDADRVDMQGFLTYEEFKNRLNSVPLAEYFILDCPEVTELDKVNKSMVNTLWGEGAHTETLFSDSAITMVFLPLIKSSVGDKWFNRIFVLIHFPHVRITNEYNRFIDITHLWARVEFNWKGRGKGYFGLNRSEYPLVQFLSGYMHSHVSQIPTRDFTYFASPCTGSGPINSTLSTLSIGFDDAMWQLFCLELDRYVRVESIAGVPYHKLEKIGTVQFGTGADHFQMETLFVNYPVDNFWNNKSERFIKHLLKSKVLSFNYQNNQYGLAMSWIEFIIAISNSFIEWYNKEYNEGIVTENYDTLISRGIIKEAIIQDGKVYYTANRRNISSTDVSRYIGKKICTFKGRDITLNITGITPSENTSNKSVVLNLQYAELILGGILRFLNYNYGREGNTGEGSEETASSSSAKRYL